MRNLARHSAFLFALLAVLLPIRAWAPYGVPGGGGAGVTSVTCSAPFACAPATGAAAFTWTGASITGTPQAGDMSYWTGATTEALIQNSLGTYGSVLQRLTAGAAPAWTANPVLGVLDDIQGSLGLASNAGIVTLKPSVGSASYNFNFPTTVGTAGQFLTSQGGGTNAMTWTSGGGSAALSALTAASAANTIANADFLQTWQAAKTTDSSGFLRITESAASTGGTSTSGVPNQYLAKIDTVAASTASPLTLYSRGNHVASVSPSTAQILGTDGSAAAPTYSFASGTGTGMYVLNGGGALRFTINGALTAALGSSSFLVPSLSDSNFGSVSLLWNTDHMLAISDQADGEWARFLTRAFQVSRGSADATAYAINARKSRGSVGTPTVITTGDALLTESGFGYVGGTNTYREATRIEHDSTGTIADATTGIGGTIKLQTAKAGTDTAPQTNVTITGGSTGSVTIASGTTLNPATVAGIVGTTAADSAQAGSIGEVQSCTVATASSVTLTTNTTANICTINTLPAGDWDCTGVVDFTFGATTSYTNLTGGISTTSATLGGQDTKFDYETAANVPTAGADAAWVIPTVRENIGSATQVWLVAQATFTVSTLKAYGTLRCRRMR